ncbi:FAD binding domain-containing protein (plasmid) [Streptomyces sp. HUAS TT11]|uniref:FAD binding domain-containing protein n=1 Tax=Streptomyces sp. HUAS TT11 TaxID=3447508 RepID=UPI003F656727
MKQFIYDRPTQVRDALTLMSQNDRAQYLAGGTNLVDLMKSELEGPSRLVDVRHLPLQGIHETHDGGLFIGATTTNSDVAAHAEVRSRYPALSQAILAGASGQLRNMATVGGNLLQRTRCNYFADRSEPCNKRAPGSGCAAVTGEHHNHAILEWSDHCMATNPSDMAVPLAAFDAVVHYETLGGTHDIALSEFYPPVGDTPQRETLLPPGALITGVTLPTSAESPRSRYRKVRERASYAFANVSVAAALDVREGSVDSVRIAFGGVASRPWRALTAEAVLQDQPATASMFRAAVDAELSAARPLEHNRYKVALARNLAETVLTGLVEQTV